MDSESGTVNWQNSSLYISGNYNFFDNAFLTLINICLRSAQNQNFSGVGSGSNISILNNVFHIAGVSGTGSIQFSSACFINITDARMVCGSASGNYTMKESTVNGSIYSIYGNEAINVSSMTGNASLEYRYAVQYNGDWNTF